MARETPAASRPVPSFGRIVGGTLFNRIPIGVDHENMMTLLTAKGIRKNNGAEVPLTFTRARIGATGVDFVNGCGRHNLTGPLTNLALTSKILMTEDQGGW